MPTSIKLSNLGILKAVTTCPACGYEHTLSAHTSINAHPVLGVRESGYGIRRRFHLVCERCYTATPIAQSALNALGWL